MRKYISTSYLRRSRDKIRSDPANTARLLTHAHTHLAIGDWAELLSACFTLRSESIMVTSQFRAGQQREMTSPRVQKCSCLHVRRAVSGQAMLMLRFMNISMTWKSWNVELIVSDLDGIKSTRALMPKMRYQSMHSAERDIVLCHHVCQRAVCDQSESERGRYSKL